MNFRRYLLSLAVAVTLVGCGGKASLPTARLTANATQGTAVTNQITITVTGFEPATMTIKKGTTVTWTNRDQADHWVASDPYPIHTGLAGFAADRATAPGGTYQFTFARVGEWPYHDHLRPVTYTGVVVVTE